MRTKNVLLGAAALLLASPAFAQAPSSPFQGLTRFAGTVEKLDGRRLTVATEDGAAKTLELPDSLQITESKRATMSDLEAGKFVGCTAVTASAGKLRASECHIFPDSMRGRGEGHNPMGPPNTTMTNGNIATMTNGSVQSAQGGGAGVVLHVTYQGGAQDIEVTKETQITQISVGDASLLKRGAKVSGAARETDGALRVQFLNVTP
ncbi:MAG TPA: hypothetical protein VFV10_20865 [Gammaproteobacteria bacterium]|nr:hypothetical protein [Gammaproteobacteria bacterium]